MKIAVIGGGAAGCMAAFFACKNGADTTLFERTEKIGKKIFITGKGRCNVTNNCGAEDVLENVMRNRRFLYSAVYGMPPSELMELLESYGLRLKVERGRRVFPESDKSSDVLKALRKMLADAGVRTQLNSRVEKIDGREGDFGVYTDGRRHVFDRVIVATGGVSYPATGSTGDGLEFARSYGLKVTKLYPSLVGLNAKEKHICADLAGLSLKNVSLTLLENGKEKYFEQGEMLFSHEGITGPLVLTASAHISDFGFSHTTADINFKPALSREKLDARIRRELSGAKQISTAVSTMLPKKLVGHVLNQAGIAQTRRCAEITRAEREALLAALTGFRLNIKGAGDIAGAIVTRGGVSVKSLSPRSCAAKDVPGLYFAGEVTDVDALTGGYNLQVAFSMGRLAGIDAAKEN